MIHQENARHLFLFNDKRIQIMSFGIFNYKYLLTSLTCGDTNFYFSNDNPPIFRLLL